jgi:hypothetical protein
LKEITRCKSSPTAHDFFQSLFLFYDAEMSSQQEKETREEKDERTEKQKLQIFFFSF